VTFLIPSQSIHGSKLWSGWLIPVQSLNWVS